MRIAVVGLLAILSGCASVADDVPVPADGTPYVEALSGGGLYGYTRTRIWQGDIAETGTQPPFGTAPETVTRQMAPAGTFAAVVAEVAQLGPAALAALTEPEDICMDYGLDRVSADPAINGFATVQVSCPDPAVAALVAAITAAVP